ncbi:MAG: hypothetical protein KGV50_01955 [Gammaproteobacteria bacterium]|nr:hypothetical protein [Gammaproteobacteria bacterium]
MKNKQENTAPIEKQWRTTLIMAFFGLPFISLLFICAYGFITWFGQMLFWGPPT